MKTSSRIALWLIGCFISVSIAAQHKGSLDLGEMYNGHSKLHGVNLSYFHHLDEHWSAGLECIRFFPAQKQKNGETITLSAWDLELNAHYNIPESHVWAFYPLVGFGHTREEEKIASEKELLKTWSLNTGAGISYEKGHWVPHLECYRSWGKFNQLFFLAGVSYEIDWR